MPRDGYRVEGATTLGTLGSVRLLDTPYTVSVLPGDVMTNGQVKNFKEASKYLPLVEFQEMQGSEILRPATRGMQGSNMQNARMDGMGIVVTGANSMESLQQIEVLNGLGGRSTDRRIRPACSTSSRSGRPIARCAACRSATTAIRSRR